MTDNAAPRTPTPVVLLTAPHCHFCSDAREIVSRLADEYLLSVEEVSIESPEGRTLAATHGVLFPPGLFIDGECLGYGRPSERKLRRALTRRAEHRLHVGIGV